MLRYSFRRSIGFFLTLLWFLAGQGSAQTLTPEMVVDLKMVVQVAMQPQGEYVAYRLRTPRGADEKPGGAYTELWVVPTEGGEPRQFVSKPHSVGSIAWTPDGKFITFTERRKTFHKHRQVYAIPIDGGEARLLSHAPRDVRQYALSPDGKYLAYTLTDKEPKEIRKQKKRGFDARVEDTWHTLTRLYVEDLSTNEVHLVTHSDENVWEFRWSPDGEHLIYRGSERPFTDDSYMLTDNYIVPVGGGEGQKLYDTEGKLKLARISPDGKLVAWLGAVDFSDPSPQSLFVMSMAGGKPRNLLENYPGSAEAFWWKDSRTILLVMIEDVRTYLYEVSVETGKLKKLMGDSGPIFGSLSFTRDMKRFATAGNAWNHPNEVFVGKTGSARLQRLTHSNPQLAGMPLGKQEVIRWKGPDDWEISGILIKPVGYEPGKRYPLQVQVHGGPEGARLDGWNTFYNRPAQLLAQRGIMVLLPNYRGSIGKGVAFSKGDHQDLMGKEFEDILAGIDYLDRQGMIDPKRVGIGGGSYGGYASAWAATKHSQRFAAAVVFVGISNQISKAGMTDIPLENATVHWNLWLYDHFDLVWDRSPLKHIHNARTPTLILHGEEDRRVPLNQAYELYRGLKYVGVPTQLIVYPREGHGNRERAHQLDFLRRALEWYERYLKGDETGATSP
ncbi:MAG: S9 family peptidase [Calditrichaeota bacterium]|nr:MAG: S9 family peptidase [Calditrichota bacterium]